MFLPPDTCKETLSSDVVGLVVLSKSDKLGELARFELCDNPSSGIVIEGWKGVSETIVLARTSPTIPA